MGTMARDFSQHKAKPATKIFLSALKYRIEKTV